ncbi:hypothetical protein [Chthonobacter albigriseus]|uniref:hypothetical protein n=1 Tax=Chthonobacter albigriseus TaxID=1683161 RepID=UPI0015EEAE70|nr:hypothetical protein [Chthonobacter albigriseus]
MQKPFEIGQRVLLEEQIHSAQRGGNREYIVRGRNDLDTREPNYLIESVADNRRRREPQGRLRPLLRANSPFKT